MTAATRKASGCREEVAVMGDRGAARDRRRARHRAVLIGAAVSVAAGLALAPATSASGPSSSAATAVARPTVRLTVTPSRVVLGKLVTASPKGSKAPAGVKSVVFSFGDKTRSVTSRSLTLAKSHRYARVGTFTVTLTVTDKKNRHASTTRRVTVTKASTTTGLPASGRWTARSLGGANGGAVSVTSVSFTVSADHKTLSGFTFAFDYAGVRSLPLTGAGCTGSTSTYAIGGAPTPITAGQFTGPVGATGPWYQPSTSPAGGSGRWQGSFDSATTAHGTATFYWSIGGVGCFPTMGTVGPFTWTAAP